MAYAPTTPTEELTEAVAVELSHEELSVPVLETPKKPRKKKTETTKAKTRTLDQLLYVDVREMTDKEKTIVIEAQAEELALLRCQNESLHNNCEQAYEKLRLVEEDMQKMDIFYRSKLNFVTEQVTAFAKTIKLATTGGTN